MNRKSRKSLFRRYHKESENTQTTIWKKIIIYRTKKSLISKRYKEFVWISQKKTWPSMHCAQKEIRDKHKCMKNLNKILVRFHTIPSKLAEIKHHVIATMWRNGSAPGLLMVVKTGIKTSEIIQRYRKVEYGHILRPSTTTPRYSETSFASGIVYDNIQGPLLVITEN